MDLINNNQKQILPNLGTTISSITNSQVSGFFDHKHGADLGSQTSFEGLTEYNKNLNSQLAPKFNNKNQIILNLKKVTMWNTTTDTEFELQNLAATNKKSTLLSKGTEYLGGPGVDGCDDGQQPNILTPVKANNNTISIFENRFGRFPIGTFASASEGGGYQQKNKFIMSMDTLISKYINSISKFNTDIATSQYLVYKYNNNKQKIISNLISILKNSFYSMYGIISRPVLHITPNKVIINLFFYISRNKNRRQIGGTPSYNNLKFLSNNHKQLQYLCNSLSKCFKKPVELELIRLYYPYNDSQILANSIGLLSKNIRNRFRTLVDNTFNFSKIKNPTKMLQQKTRISILPSFITGIKIRLGGRLLSQKVIPRFTVQTFQEGSLARTKANIVTSSRFTHKNKRGTFSITVSVGQGFF